MTTTATQSQIQNMSKLYPLYFKLHVRWLRAFTRITYLSKLIGTLLLAAFLNLNYLGYINDVISQICLRKT